MPPRVALISTIRHNVGDDLVREGILSLLEDLLGPCDAAVIHKHVPATARPGWEWIHTSGLTKAFDLLPRGKANLLSRIVDVLPYDERTDRVLSADLLVQCGTPAYYCFRNGYGAHRNEWFRPLVAARHARIRARVPFLNVGAGSCQPYGDDGTAILRNGACAAYVRALQESARLTTVRDALARDVLRRFGWDAPLLACPSIFARDRAGIRPAPPGPAVLNFMPRGGHYDLWVGIDLRRWEGEFRAFAQEAARDRAVLLACHDAAEMRAAARLLPGLPRRLVRDWREALALYAAASCYLGSRVHGACAVASFGRPAFLVGNDSRALTLDELGVPRAFVQTATRDALAEALHRMEHEPPDAAARREALRNDTRRRYRELLAPVLAAAGLRGGGGRAA